MKTISSRDITIILADDHPLLRDALRGVLEKQPDFKVIAEADNGEEAIILVEKLKPDIIIMDISMPKINGIETTKIIKTKYPNTAVLVLTVHNDSEHILGILEVGAAGYLTKSVFGSEVIHAIRSIVSGEMVFSALIFKELLSKVSRDIEKPLNSTPHEKLTQRENDILRAAAKGLSNKDIAQQLNISIPTVKSYLTEIFSKMKVSSRTEAVITGLRGGFLTLNDLG